MSKLFLIPTPIGNLQDITFRAVETLKGVDLILAEDTRHTGKLLKHYDINKKMAPYHQHNEYKVLNGLIQQIKDGTSVAMVSDAGTPGISDPGFLLVRECLSQNIEIECLPGPTALIPALVNSGFPSEQFCFEGFLPHKKGRQKRLNQLPEESRTMIFYESPHRLIKTLTQFKELFGSERKVAVARELTKIHEETIRGTLQEVIDYFSQKPIKGEIVIVVQGNSK